MRETVAKLWAILVIAAIAINLKDIIRYMRIRAM